MKNFYIIQTFELRIPDSEPQRAIVDLFWLRWDRYANGEVDSEVYQRQQKNFTN
jgi:hypothetical protein